jgi:hypothetical protein
MSPKWLPVFEGPHRLNILTNFFSDFALLITMAVGMSTFPIQKERVSTVI